MHNMRSSTFSVLVVLLTMFIVTACGDDKDNSGTEPFIFTPADNAGAGEASTSETTNEPANGTETAPEIGTPEDIEVETGSETTGDRGPAELFGAPCIRDAVCDTNVCSGSREAPGVCTLADDVQFVPFEDLLADPEAYANQRLQTEATIRGVCQRRGCWMELRSEDDPSGENINVKFLDYGFFVPLDSRGAFVRVEGIPAVQILSAEEVEELLAEGYDPGVVREDGTATLVRFVASGVMMWNRAD